MASSKLFSCIIAQLVLVVLVFDCANAQGLALGFYAKTCPQAEAIVKKIVDQAMVVSPSLSGPLLRMHFHDCFVRGCDGSVLLNSSSNQAERDAFPNLSLRGFDLIDKVKAALEKACPRVVSCADILALVARDAVVAVKGVSWKVETGRRDGRVSKLADALQNLPGANFNITQLITSFKGKGLSVKDLVVLSGGHTIGISHCTSFTSRLYNFTGKGDTDPALDPKYIAALKLKCKPGDTTTFVEMDPGSAKVFDTDYYKIVSQRRGLFQSDGALLDSSQTKAYVQQQSGGAGKSTFLEDFGVSMMNMGRVGVLTGGNGEIRKKCGLVN